MADFKKKYGAFKFNPIREDIIWIAEAPLLLMDIDVESDLGRILMAHRNGLNDEKQELFSGNCLIDDWFKKIYLDEYQTILQHIEKNKDSFALLLKQYLEYYDAIKLSVLMLSPNTIKDSNKKRFITIVELLKWAEKKIAINDKLKAVYQIEQDKVLPATFQLPTIERGNDYNLCIVKVMTEFAEINGYPPTTVEEIIMRMKYSPPHGVTVKFSNKEVWVDDSSIL